MAAVGAIDLGATNLRAAVADDAGEPLANEQVETPAGRDGRAVAQAVADALRTAADRAGVRAAALEAVGIGSIGPLDLAAGRVIHPPNLPGVEEIPLRDTLVALVGHPRIYVENDAVAGLIGERAADDDPEPNLVYLTLSTGIGAGVAVDGHVLRGRAGNVAEVGHLVVEPDGRPCGCGGAGHWEAYSSGVAIPGFARALAERSDLDTALSIGNEGPTAATVFAAAGEDPLADHVVAAVQRYNAIGVADLVHAFAPDRLVVGGAVALENPALVIEPLAAAVDQHTMLAVPEIEPPAHRHDAVLRGALALATQGGPEPSRPGNPEP